MTTGLSPDRRRRANRRPSDSFWRGPLRRCWTCECVAAVGVASGDASRVEGMPRGGELWQAKGLSHLLSSISTNALSATVHRHACLLIIITNHHSLHDCCCCCCYWLVRMTFVYETSSYVRFWIHRFTQPVYHRCTNGDTSRQRKTPHSKPRVTV